MVVGDRKELIDLFWRNEVANKSPAFHEVTDSSMSSSVPADESSDDGSDNSSFDCGRLEELLVPLEFFLLLTRKTAEDLHTSNTKYII